MTSLDPSTLRTVAQLIRKRAKSVSRDDRLDGLERLGAQKYLDQLAIHLEVSADHVGPDHSGAE